MRESDSNLTVEFLEAYRRCSNAEQNVRDELQRARFEAERLRKDAEKLDEELRQHRRLVLEKSQAAEKLEAHLTKVRRHRNELELTLREVRKAAYPNPADGGVLTDGWTLQQVRAVLRKNHKESETSDD